MKINVNALSRELSLKIIGFEEIDSTSLYFTHLIKNGEALPDAVFANKQTNGQGRVGKSFFSPADTGLYITFRFSEHDLICNYLTPRVALAVAVAIENVFHIDCGVKWVNDIYYQNKKVAGVLCQRVLEHILIGVGINVEMPNDIPSELTGRFGTLCETCDKEKYSQLIKELYDSFNMVFALPLESVLSQYRKRCIHINKKVRLENNNQIISGVCVGISDNFSIQIGDEKQSFYSGYLTI